MPGCANCGCATINAVYVATSHQWLCAECACEVAYPFLLQAADLREDRAVAAYVQRSRPR